MNEDTLKSQWENKFSLAWWHSWLSCCWCQHSILECYVRCQLCFPSNFLPMSLRRKMSQVFWPWPPTYKTRRECLALGLSLVQMWLFCPCGEWILRWKVCIILFLCCSACHVNKCFKMVNLFWYNNFWNPYM